MTSLGFMVESTKLSEGHIGCELPTPYDDADGKRIRGIGTRKLQANISELEGKLFDVDEAYLEKKFEPDSYARLKERYKSELRTTQADLDELESTAANFAMELENAVCLLSDLAGIYERASLEARKEMLVRIWPDHLRYEDGKFRTNPETDLIALFRPESPKKRNARGPKASGVLLGCPTRIRT